MATNTQPNSKSAKKSANDAGLAASLQKLATSTDRHGKMGFGTRVRNYFLTGLLIVGPLTITIYIIWWFINVVDAWVKPFVPAVYLPETYLPFEVPGIGLIFGFAGLTMIGALMANLLGRSLVSYGELILSRMPIVRNVYRALKQIFESAVTAAGPDQSFQKVGLIEFPSKGIWSVVLVTGETTGEIQAAMPTGERDLLTVFMPTGVVPPTGFICFVPRRDVTLLDMSAEDAAKIIISAGMVTPDVKKKMDAGSVVAPGGALPGAIPIVTKEQLETLAPDVVSATRPVSSASSPKETGDQNSNSEPSVDTQGQEKRDKSPTSRRRRRGRTTPKHSA